MPDAAVVVPFTGITESDLVLERHYAGGDAGTIADDPLARMFPIGNQGGFRYKGSVANGDVKLVVLYTTGVDPDWPDIIDPETGDFTYYGDNKNPGSSLHETRRHGNQLLSDMFRWSRESPEARRRVPPILLFERTGPGRTIRFRGLLAPGSARLSAEEELVAVWRTSQGSRFQNYRAHFTVLREGVIPRTWIDDVLAGDPLGVHCPPAWRRWVHGRIYDALEAPRTTTQRARVDQYPTPQQMPLLDAVYRHFRPNPVAFEHFAADLWLRSDRRVEEVDVTRPTRDGGRDAIGKYKIGPETDPIRIDFALEAKCYAPGASVGVRDVSRLISRIKHRDFGVFVTTSHIGPQPYAEVREDRHPIVFITGRDIVDILRGQGLTTVSAVEEYLEARHALPAGAPPAREEGTIDQIEGGDILVDAQPSESPRVDPRTAAGDREGPK